MKIFKFIFAHVLLFIAAHSSGQSIYNEQYRPQFHFTPQSGWIGDPDGLIKYQNKYHLFWWGHAESEDLVFWDQKIHPMRGDDGSFSYYTGSVVIDENNTSGLGNGINPPMIAIYTAHNKISGIQDQRISVSHDYEIFQYYAGNPVLDIGSKEFRDPDVFWDEITNRWIMCITMPIERRIDFYASDNLLSWEKISSFGPVGAREQVWEVPQLLQLPLDGNPNDRRWVMICSMGPNKMQYFIGEFDGTNFILNQEEEDFLNEGVGLPGVVFESFEDGYGDWLVEGAAFGTSPSSGTLSNQNMVSGFLGNKLVNSYLNGDASTGRMISPNFTIEKNNINFLIGGGNHPGQTCINLIVNGSMVKTATGDNSESLKWKGWNVSEWIGREAKLEIVDNYSGGWGHINVDHIVFSDILMNNEREHARWIDFGADFYAARAYRDYDQPTSLPVVWLGWMGNWEYANQVPTSWGRGIISIPRTIELKNSNSGIQLVQTPIADLQKLRGEALELPSIEIDQTKKIDHYQFTRNTYELEANFKVSDADQHFGLRFFVGSTGKLILGYDAVSSMVYLDRMYAGNNTFSPHFSKLNTAPLVNRQGLVKFHVFIDQSSIEVFVNDGELVFSSLVFPYDESFGIELFSLNGTTTLESLKAWELKSIWGVEPPKKVTGTKLGNKSKAIIYPNPCLVNNTLTIDLSQLAEVDKNIDLKILDVNGRVKYRKEIPILYEQFISIIPQLTSGIYILTIISDKRNVKQKLIIR